MNKLKLKKKKQNQPGSALLITILMLAGILSISIASGYLVWSGAKMIKVQSNSVKAYFAGEAGAERVLWETRNNGISWNDGSGDPILKRELSSGSSYKVYYRENSPIKMDSIGEYRNTKRSVQLLY